MEVRRTALKDERRQIGVAIEQAERLANIDEVGRLKRMLPELDRRLRELD
jgi:transcription elongation GreA/GreB family factor